MGSRCSPLAAERSVRRYEEMEVARLLTLTMSYLRIALILAVIAPLAAEAQGGGEDFASWGCGFRAGNS